MTRWSWVLAAVGVGLLGCDEAPAGQCGGLVCGAGQRCDADSLTCLEDVAPLVSVTAPTSVVTSETFTVTGAVRDDVSVKTATWAFDGADARALELQADGRFSLTVSAPAVDEQAFNVVVTASDGTRSTTAVATVRVDRVGPALTLLAPDAGVTLGGSAPATVEVRADDASGALASARIGTTELASPQVGATLSATVTVPVGLDAQPFDVVVRATDRHGNEAVRTFTLVGDTTAPTATLSRPTQGATLTTATYRVEGTAPDPTRPVTVRVRLTPTTEPAVIATVSPEGGWFADVAVPSGEQAGLVEVEVTDGVGNAAQLSRPVVVDRVPPTVALDAPAADSLHREAFTVTATTGGDAVSVSAQLGTGAPVTLTGGPTSWTAQVPLPTQDYGPVALVLTAVDQAGNSATAQRQVLVDTVAPVITFTAPAAGRKFNVADFAATNDVAVAWQVQDGDPQATVTQVNGAPGTATQLLVTTSTADNGRVVTTAVAAADRAGNTATASRTFSVDRVTPTLTAWTPAAATRNLDPRTTSVSFSEPVFGATTSTDALVLSPAPPAAGSWNTAHTGWTSGALTPYTVFDATLANLADDHGNPVAVSARKFHTAAVAASTAPAAPLATGVTDFRVVSDADGVATVAYRTTATPGMGQTTFTVRRVSPQAMALEPALTGDASTTTVTDFGLNAWSAVNATTLEARNIAAYSWTSPMTAGPSPLTYQRRREGGAVVSTPVTAIGPAAALSVLPFSREPDQSEFGHVEGTTFTRGGTGVTLPITVTHHVAQGVDSWAGFRLDAAAVRWTRFRCNRYLVPAPGSWVCEGLAYGAPTSALPTQLSAAMNRGGTCLIASWTESGQRKALAQSLPSCDGAPSTQCPSNTALASSTQADGFSVAPFSVGSSSSLLAAYQVGFTVQLGTLADAATCNLSFTPHGAALAGTTPVAWAPAQLGQKAALFYLDAGGALRVYVP